MAYGTTKIILMRKHVGRYSQHTKENVDYVEK
jgi:hypothetical protein